MAKKKVLVVGGAGFVGGAVTDILQERKIPYAVYDSLIYDDRYLKLGGEFIFGDVRDTTKLKKVLKDYTDVIWLAAIVGDGACYMHSLAAVEINDKAVKWLAHNYRGRIIFTSSCSVYGSNEELLDEQSPVKPLSLYATTKLNAENYLARHPRAIALRLGTAFGIADDYTRLRTDLLVNTLTASAIERGYLTVFGGSQRRPLIHVKNIAQTLVHNTSTQKAGIYNVATNNHDVKTVARMVQKFTKCKIKYTDQQFEDSRHYHVSTKKAQKDKIISVNNKFDVNFGIAEVARLIRSGRIKDVDNDVYSNVKHVAKNKI
jgi:nucleoside-diphosphate-sugar epimerase